MTIPEVAQRAARTPSGLKVGSTSIIGTVLVLKLLGFDMQARDNGQDTLIAKNSAAIAALTAKQDSTLRFARLILISMCNNTKDAIARESLMCPPTILPR
jgi:hypothetical protein